MKSLDSSFFTHNREKAIEKLKGGMLVMAGYTGMQLSNDEEVKFRQEGNFWYLTGVEFPDWWLIIDAKRGKSWLVEPDIDEMHRLFTESLDLESAKKRSGITEILTRDQAMSMLRTAAKSHQLIYTVGVPSYSERFGFTLNPAPTDMRQMLERTFAKVDDFRLELARIRAIKQPIEIAMIQSAIDLTAKSLTDIKRNINSYKHEYQIEADLGHSFRYDGAQGHGFEPIIASGANATVAHYFTNDSPLKKGTFIMLDVGAKVGGYPADITRTYAYGKPTKRMEAVHKAVQSAQAAIISILKPGLSLEEYQKFVDTTIKQEMIGLGIIESVGDETGYRRHMPYSISHGLGVDVHDALGRPHTFEPGMILTVEPGIHLGNEGIGVRIEDDILITETGHRNLSGKLPTDL
ncbi:MAG: putative Xaa-Pro aminopeptidase [Candidatus Saccharibacteria bacterium]|nr:putative Xaa-Pro aminopeptidase [Candidatus Saccharibacteria bacterium]